MVELQEDLKDLTNEELVEKAFEMMLDYLKKENKFSVTNDVQLSMFFYILKLANFSSRGIERLLKQNSIQLSHNECNKFIAKGRELFINTGFFYNFIIDNMNRSNIVKDFEKYNKDCNCNS